MCPAMYSGSICKLLSPESSKAVVSYKLFRPVGRPLGERSMRIAPVKSFRLYRECTGAVRLGSKMRLIAGAFPIRRLVLSR